MSFGLFCCFVLASSVLLTMVFIYREKLIDIEDALFGKVVSMIRKAVKK